MQHATQTALLCASERWCAFCFHANSLSSFIFLTSSSYASDELGLLQILLKCTHYPPCTTPLQRNKTKTQRSYKCKPVILLVSAPWLTNGTADVDISIWNTSLAASTSWLPFSAVVSCSAPHNSFPLWRQLLRGLHCRLVMIYNYTDACTHGVKGRWWWWGGRSLLRIKGLDLKWTSVLADAFSQDALLNSAPGHRKSNFQAPGCVCQ